MFIARTMIAIGLLAVSIVVAAHFILTPFYQDTMDIGLMWDILNWFMAVAAIIALIVNYHRFQVTDGQSGDGPVTRQYLQVNVALFASILLVIWILWNWFDNLMIGVRTTIGHPFDLLVDHRPAVRTRYGRHGTPRVAIWSSQIASTTSAMTVARCPWVSSERS